MGKDKRGPYMLVVHTFEELDEKSGRIRICFSTSAHEHGSPLL